ncbi:hypothetical protein CH298_04205 [Rhodococcoides fascians]|uniref:hypothetical protein n=1 Tax=Rhodococcoides fascians TaxID=1828 RepID=UPI000B9C0A34|nr:hypothetical protein [Rhodococcus fascians]OZE92708.1 hypothetical protein CH303_04200 [Rhodococcus fascians]OZF23341.1 hypothetical protein CH298_04205 [Rhodococcus fascians]OZF25054.1 hypothetical protein CH297_04200 [Rhodococcus fascians]OZF72650.1 hypothetical protein CH308_04205 [Rhodococcus fascians]OZF73949.1 hypothetical protein CH307_04205 [Rhodococcus fascians]
MSAGSMAISHEQVQAALEILGIARGAEQNVVCEVRLEPGYVYITRAVRADNKNLVQATETVGVRG